MRMQINYKAGGGFTVEAEDQDEFELMVNVALRILWGKTTDKMTLNETARWLGWETA